MALLKLVCAAFFFRSVPPSLRECPDAASGLIRALDWESSSSGGVPSLSLLTMLRPADSIECVRVISGAREIVVL